MASLTEGKQSSSLSESRSLIEGPMATEVTEADESICDGWMSDTACASFFFAAETVVLTSEFRCKESCFLHTDAGFPLILSCVLEGFGCLADLLRLSLDDSTFKGGSIQGLVLSCLVRLAGAASFY